MDDDADQESENEDCNLSELNMDQLLGSGSLSSLRCFLGRQRLEPLPEEEDTSGSAKDQVGWWWQRFQSATSKNVGSSSDGNERDRIFARLSQEDEEFRRKIVNLHRKLSDVEDTCTNETSDSLKISKEAERLKELESVARRAEETRENRDAEQANKREGYLSTELGDTRSRRYRRNDTQHERRKRMEFFRRKSNKLEEDSDDQNDNSPSRTTEKNFLNRLRIKRRSMKLLSFLSGKAADRSQEERAARLLRMYMPEKGSKAQNTISIHHTSRDRRFWKLRSRRRTNSS